MSNYNRRNILEITHGCRKSKVSQLDIAENFFGGNKVGYSRVKLLSFIFLPSLSTIYREFRGSTSVHSFQLAYWQFARVFLSILSCWLAEQFRTLLSTDRKSVV